MDTKIDLGSLNRNIQDCELWRDLSQVSVHSGVVWWTQLFIVSKNLWLSVQISLCIYFRFSEYEKIPYFLVAILNAFHILKDFYLTRNAILFKSYACVISLDSKLPLPAVIFFNFCFLFIHIAKKNSRLS